MGCWWVDCIAGRSKSIAGVSDDARILFPSPAHGSRGGRGADGARTTLFHGIPAIVLQPRLRPPPTNTSPNTAEASRPTLELTKRRERWTHYWATRLPY